MQGAMGAISYVHGLRVLRIEDIHCRLEQEAVTDLGSLTQVRGIFIFSARASRFLRARYRKDPIP